MRILLSVLVVFGVSAGGYFITKTGKLPQPDEKKEDSVDSIEGSELLVIDQGAQPSPIQALPTPTMPASKTVTALPSKSSETVENSDNLELNLISNEFDNQESEQVTKSDLKAVKKTRNLLPHPTELQTGLQIQEKTGQICNFEFCQPLGRDGVLISGIHYHLGSTRPSYTSTLTMGSWYASSPLLYVGLD